MPTAQALRVARANGRRRMQEAVDATEKAIDGWSFIAADAIRQAMARTRRDQHLTMEEIREKIRKLGLHVPPPKDLRAWGGATSVALREGVIEKTGAFKLAAFSNASPKACYRRAF